MHWLLEANLFGDGEHPLAAAARAAGHRVSTWQEEWWSLIDSARDGDTTVMFHGSLGHAARLAQAKRWRPGAYCNTAALACSAWYPQARRWLVQRDYGLSTVAALVADPYGVAGALAREGRVFVRPDSPLKPFAGRVVALDGLTAAQLDHGFYYDELELPIVLAPVQSLGAEWRLLIADRKVVAGSAYQAEGRRARGEPVPAAVRSRAAEIAAEIDAPDPVYVMDLVETERGLGLLELNPFSGADLYACAPEQVVVAVAAAAAPR
jgi:ATP-grasp domain, R2K clade family 3